MKAYYSKSVGESSILLPLVAFIETALKDRDERAAKTCDDLVTFTEDHGDQEPCKWCEALETAARKIRGKD